MKTQTLAVDIADELARRVATGELGPGQLMPSIRQLAEEFDLNRATAQLILGRLESYGFVTAQRGRGFTVRDVHTEGGLEAYGRLFRLAIPDPAAATMFRGLVAEQQAIVTDTLLAYTDSARTVLPAALKAEVDELERLERSGEQDYHQMLGIELRLLRTLLTALGRGMQRAMLNSIGDLVLDAPAAVQAYYAVGADLHVLVWRALIAVWESGNKPSAAQLTLFVDICTIYHERVVARFDELLDALGADDQRQTA